MGKRNYRGVKRVPDHPWVADQMRGVALSAPRGVRQIRVHRNSDPSDLIGNVTLVAAPGDTLRFCGFTLQGTCIWERTVRVPPRGNQNEGVPPLIEVKA